MKKRFFLWILMPIITMAQEAEIVNVVDPVVDNSMQVLSFGGCAYSDNDTYLINKNYVVYQDCETRKILHPDMLSFRFPTINEGQIVALDKNGVYFKGNFIKMDTTGFAIVGRNNDYENMEVLWKTKNAVYKNTQPITVSDVATFEPVECLNGAYFKDKNFMYYFDKKIENSDAASVQKSCNEFTYDKNNAYLNGKIITYEGEKIIPVNNILFKTTKKVLTRNEDKFTVQPSIDAASLKGLSEDYAIDKNHVYYGTGVLPIPKENLINVKVWEQVNRAYVGDGKKIYSRDNDLPNTFDAQTFGMLPHSDFCFDKNGVYERQWIEEQDTVVYQKFPFHYTQPVSLQNTFITDDSRYIVYENQAYDPWEKKMYKNLTSQQIAWAKQGTFRVDKVGDIGVKIDQEYEYMLYKANNKIYWNGKETNADAKTFKTVGGNYYKDAKNVYMYSFGQGLMVVNGMDNESLTTFNGFFIDKNYLYYYNHKIIENKDIELLAVFGGYRKGCSQDRTPGSNFYLFKNADGYYLAEVSDAVRIRKLGKKLPNQKEWIPNLNEPFQLSKE